MNKVVSPAVRGLPRLNHMAIVDKWWEECIRQKWYMAAGNRWPEYVPANAVGIEFLLWMAECYGDRFVLDFFPTIDYGMLVRAINRATLTTEDRVKTVKGENPALQIPPLDRFRKV